MSQTAESLVEERVMQLQEITRRRNELLREMFHLVQKRHNLGSLLTLEEEEEGDEHGLHLFLERFDLEKHPEMGHISSLLEDEVALPETPPAYSPVGLPEPEPPLEPESATNVLSDSPMSDPPVSPPAHEMPPAQNKRREEEEEEEEEGEEEEEEEEEAPPIPDVPIPQADVCMDVDSAPLPAPEAAPIPKTEPDTTERMPSREPSEVPKAAPGSPGFVEQVLHPTQDVVPGKSPTPTQEVLLSASHNPSSQESLVAQSTTESLPATREPSSSRTSLPPSQRLHSPHLRFAHDVPDGIKAEPLDEDIGVVEAEPQMKSPSPVDRAIVPFETVMPAQLTNEHSEDQIMAILGPPAPVDEHVRHPVIDYSIPLPHLEASASFSFNDGADHPMAVEQTKGPHEFGPDPPYPIPSLHTLPMEFGKKKPSSKHKHKDSKKDEWRPLGLNRWAAVLRANPVHTKLSRATKCLSTRDWSVGITEMHLLRVFERVETLKDASAWSFRQPKKQRGVGGGAKTHWDYLLDEMRWMRTDFREERRWKLALAYNLAHAVVEWHEAGSLEERVRRGIVVLWKPPPAEDTEMTDVVEGEGEEADGPFRETQDTDENGVDSRETGSPNDGYGSDDESDDEQDKDPVADSLEPGQALQEALEQLEQGPTQQDSQGVTFKPKVEEIEDLTALSDNNARNENAMAVDGSKPADAEARKPEDASAPKPSVPEVHSGLKASSKNPVLGPGGREGDGVPVKAKKISNVLRDSIMYADVNKLFIDLDDLDLVKGMSELSTEDPLAPPVPHDITAIFPDINPIYEMLDVAPPPGSVQEGKKKSDRKADKDNKRGEDWAFTKLTPTSKFMLVKPTLVGTLRPASNFKDGQWSQIEETPVFADVEVPPARPVDENLCALFEGIATKTSTPTGHPAFMPPPPRDVRKRNAEHADAVAWTPTEDALLKQAVERYPYNWNLIADAFNSSRVTIPTDKRTPWECLERWRERFSAAARGDAGEDSTPSAASTSASVSHMTTRGYKRSANQSATMSGNGAASLGNPGEPRKRRRHAAMHDTFKRSAKKRDQTQKSNAVPRPKPTAVHDTHGQFTKLPKLTPAELSRMKAEKEARDAQELLLRRRNDELARQHILREQAQRAQAQGMPQNAQQPQTPQGQMLPPGANVNGVPRPANGVPQVQSIRSSQVGISSQQQRIAAALAANANARMSPPQLAAQAAHLRAMAQGQALPQAQGQVPAPSPSPGQGQMQTQAQVSHSNASAALTAAAPALSAAHLSPSFAARATSSSPSAPHHSPPLPAASPPNANVVPRPPSVPSQAVQGLQVNPLLQMPNMRTPFFVPGMQGIPSLQIPAGLTQEQLMALIQQQQARQQQQQQPYAHAQQQNPPNGNFPH